MSRSSVTRNRMQSLARLLAVGVLVAAVGCSDDDDEGTGLPEETMASTTVEAEADGEVGVGTEVASDTEVDPGVEVDSDGASSGEGDVDEAAETTAPRETTTTTAETDATEASDTGGTGDATDATADAAATLPDSAFGEVVVGVDGTQWVRIAGDPVGSGSDLVYESYAWFDGDQWVSIGSPDRVELDGDDGVDGSAVYGMQISGGPDGTLWVVNTGFDSIGDLYFWDGTTWSSPTTPPDVWIVTGVTDLDGSVWTLGVPYGADAGDDEPDIALWHYDGEAWTEHPAPEGGIWCVFCVDYGVDADGTLWLRNDAGTWAYDGDVWSPTYLAPA